MRLNEFYDPEKDEFAKADKEDTRKNKLTLEDLNKLRKYRDIKRAEEHAHEKFVRVMYAQPSEEGGGVL
jgi:hypothetical protein